MNFESEKMIHNTVCVWCVCVCAHARACLVVVVVQIWRKVDVSFLNGETCHMRKYVHIVLKHQF
jgi:hypothetical protein